MVIVVVVVVVVVVIIAVETQFPSTSGGSPFQCGASSSSSSSSSNYLSGDSVSVYQWRLSVSVWSQALQRGSSERPVLPTAAGLDVEHRQERREVAVRGPGRARPSRQLHLRR